MRICLFTLTGMGNAIIAEMMKVPLVEDVIVFTRKEKGPFPHYDCEELSTVCRRLHIRVYEDQRMDSLRVAEVVGNIRPDVILAATFNQKIHNRIIDIPKMGAFNIHPSLLPYYRGPTPTNWAVINGEKESGITFQLIGEDFDRGDILFQRKTSISGLVDGDVRKKLANLAAQTLNLFLTKYAAKVLKLESQNKYKGSYFPRITSPQGVALLKSAQFDRNNLIRGLTPYPGIEILE